MENDAWKGWLRSEMRWEQLAIEGARRSTSRGFRSGAVAAAVFWGWCHVAYQLPTTTASPKVSPCLENLSAYSIPSLSLSIHCYSTSPTKLAWCWWYSVHRPGRFGILFPLFCKWVDYDHFEWSTRQIDANSEGRTVNATAIIGSYDLEWFKCHRYFCMLIGVGHCGLNSRLSRRNIVNPHRLRIWMEVHTWLSHCDCGPAQGEKSE